MQYSTLDLHGVGTLDERGWITTIFIARHSEIYKSHSCSLGGSLGMRPEIQFLALMFIATAKELDHAVTIPTTQVNCM